MPHRKITETGKGKESEKKKKKRGVVGLGLKDEQQRKHTPNKEDELYWAMLKCINAVGK